MVGWAAGAGKHPDWTPICLTGWNAVGCVPPRDGTSIPGAVGRGKWDLGKGCPGALGGRGPKSMVGGAEARSGARSELPGERCLSTVPCWLPPRRSEVLLAGWGCPRDKRG